MPEVSNIADSLVFPGAEESELAYSQHTSGYATKFATELVKGRRYITDPDIALAADPDAYSKLKTETSIYAKAEKRAGRAASADWSVTAPNDDVYEPVAKLIGELFKGIKRLPVALKTLSLNSTIRGRSIARIEGKIATKKLKGDFVARNWWIPTRLKDVNKRRMRINHVPEDEQQPGGSEFYWAIQDLRTYKWYKIGGPDATPGLRTIDYVEAIFGNDEEDLGYGHGLMRSLYHSYFMKTHATMYQLEGAETWAFGKTVVKTPRNQMSSNSLVGADSVDDGFSQTLTQNRNLARSIKDMIRDDVIAINSEQEIEVLSRPESGVESVTTIIDRIDNDFAELILGRRKGENHEWDIDPDIVVWDRMVLENAVNEHLMYAVLFHNRANFEALGWTLEELVDNVEWTIARQSILDTETLGNNMMRAQALGAPVHRNDVYTFLSLTPVADDDPNGLYQPQAGQPITGATVQMRDDPLIEGDAPTLEPPAPGGVSSAPPMGNMIRVQA